MTTKIPAELSSTPGISDSSNATAITIDSSERVGIGTTSPAAPLHIQISSDSGGIFADSNVALTLKNNSSTDDSAIAIAFQTNQGTATMLQTVFPNADTNRHGELYVSTADSGGTLAERARFTHEGLRFPNGMGLDFQSTGSGINSSVANSSLFDDYEEGTWSPTAAGVATATSYGARYTKIGQLVMAECYILINTQNNTDQFRIAGLPYTSHNVTAYGGGSIGYVGSSNLDFLTAPLVPGNTSYAYFHYIDGQNSGASVTNNKMYTIEAGNQLFIMQCFYRTA